MPAGSGLVKPQQLSVSSIWKALGIT